jgi:hypothetical protein
VGDLLGKVDLEVAEDLAARHAPPLDGRIVRILEGIAEGAEHLVQRLTDPRFEDGHPSIHTG